MTETVSLAVNVRLTGGPAGHVGELPLPGQATATKKFAAKNGKTITEIIMNEAELTRDAAATVGVIPSSFSVGHCALDGAWWAAHLAAAPAGR